MADGCCVVTDDGSCNCTLGMSLGTADGCCVVTDDGSCDCTLGMSLGMAVYWMYGFEHPKELRKTFTIFF